MYSDKTENRDDIFSWHKFLIIFFVILIDFRGQKFLMSRIYLLLWLFYFFSRLNKQEYLSFCSLLVCLSVSMSVCLCLSTCNTTSQSMVYAKHCSQTHQPFLRWWVTHAKAVKSACLRAKSSLNVQSLHVSRWRLHWLAWVYLRYFSSVMARGSGSSRSSVKNEITHFCEEGLVVTRWFQVCC